jgi:hypothetical protein
MNKKKSKDEWFELVEAFKASGLTLTTWCKEKCISKSSIYPYLKKYDSQNNYVEPQWVALPINKNNEATTLSLKVGSVTLDIKNGYDKDALADVLSLLIKLC